MLSKRWVKLVLFLLIIVSGILVLVFWNNYISEQSKENIYNNIDAVPKKKALLVLGTAKYVATGRKNYFYTYRIEATVALYKAGKVQAILVSGDNATKYYDEPTTMKKDLIKAGIPSKYITLDYAGFRTLDSIIRAKAIFGLSDYIIVSQKFHLERAIYIAQSKGHKVIGFRAKDFANTPADYRMRFREHLARAKAFLDIHILDTKAKFYGRSEKVTYREE